MAKDDPFSAFEISSILSEAGMRVVGPASTVREATGAGSRPDARAAIPDIDLAGAMIYGVVDILLARTVPIILVSAYDADAALPEKYLSLPSLQKPINGRMLIEHLHLLLGWSAAAQLA